GLERSDGADALQMDLHVAPRGRDHAHRHRTVGTAIGSTARSRAHPVPDQRGDPRRNTTCDYDPNHARAPARLRAHLGGTSRRRRGHFLTVGFHARQACSSARNVRKALRVVKRTPKKVIDNPPGPKPIARSSTACFDLESRSRTTAAMKPIRPKPAA